MGKEVISWVEISSTLKLIIIRAIKIILESIFLLICIWTLGFVDDVISIQIKPTGITEIIFMSFKIMFAVSACLPVALFIYRDITITFVRIQQSIRNEIVNDETQFIARTQYKKYFNNLTNFSNILINGISTFFSIIGLYIISLLFVLISIFDLQFISLKVFEFLFLSLFILISVRITFAKTYNTKVVYVTALIYKRCLDLIFSLIGTMIFLSSLSIVGIFFSIFEKGPVLYRTIAIGKGGRPFEIYKFRTMYVNKNEFTLFGRFLTKYRLAEMPTILNVLLGEMSLVGPRPRWFNNQEILLDEVKKILTVKPGITDLPQVSTIKKYNYEDIIKYNLEYVKNWTLLLDLKIFLKTILLNMTK